MPELTTTTLVGAYLNDASLGTALTTYVAAAEAFIARICGRYDLAGNHWLSASRVEYLDGNNWPAVFLKFTPITAVASVSLVTSSSTTSSYTLTELEVDGIAIADLTTSLAGMQGRLGLRSVVLSSPAAWDAGWNPPYSPMWDRSPNFGGGRNRVKVTYTGGYTTAPADLALAATMAAATMYRSKDTDYSKKSEGLGEYSYTNADAALVAQMGPQFEALIAPYRRNVF